MKLKLACGFYLLLACLLPKCAAGQGLDGVYRGTLGKQEVVLEIGVNPTKTNVPHLIGRYFYRRHGIGISLKGERAPDGSYLLTEYQGSKSTGAHWRLRFQADEATGIFCKCDLGRTGTEAGLPVQLKRISPGFDPDFDTFVNEPGSTSAPHKAYFDLLLDSPLTAGPEVATKRGYAYVLMADPRFRVSMPRITRFPDPAAMMQINLLLERELSKYRLEAAACLQGLDFGGGEFDFHTKIELFSRHLITVVRQGSLFCGGAHPDSETNINTYDLDSKTETSVDDLLAREIDFQAVKKLISPNEQDAAQPIAGLIAELYIRHYKSGTEDCRDVISRDESTKAPTFTTLQYLGEHGLVVIPSVAHVVQACAEPVVIPYDELRPLLKMKSQLFSLVGTAP